MSTSPGSRRAGGNAGFVPPAPPTTSFSATAAFFSASLRLDNAASSSSCAATFLASSAALFFSSRALRLRSERPRIARTSMTVMQLTPTRVPNAARRPPSAAADQSFVCDTAHVASATMDGGSSGCPGRLPPPASPEPSPPPPPPDPRSSPDPPPSPPSDAASGSSFEAVDVMDWTSITAEGGLGASAGSGFDDVFSSTSDGSSARFGILSLAMARGAVNPTATRPRTSGAARRETPRHPRVPRVPRRATATGPRRGADVGPGTAREKRPGAPTSGRRSDDVVMVAFERAGAVRGFGGKRARLP